MPGHTRRSSSRGRKQNSDESVVNTGRSRSRSASRSTSANRSRSANRSASANRSTSASRSTQRKRKRSPSFSGEIPKVLKRTVDGRIVDVFCWVCHKLGSESICDSCPRVYHEDCLKKLKGKSGNSPSCECQLKTVDGRNENLNLDVRELKKLLQYVMQEAIKEEKKNNQKSHLAENSRFCRLFQAWPSENDDLCKIMDLNILLDNMNGEEPYLSTGQFFLDVKWIYHNCCILYGPNYDITEAALKLEKNFKQELIDMEACPECYYNKYSDGYVHADFFTKICRKPHTIVWAKLRGSPYWPAKCLKMHNGYLDVRFFGTHDKSNIAINKCYKISKDNPLNTSIQQQKYKDSIVELSIYVQNYESLIGPFPYYPRKTVLEDSNASRKKSSKKGQHRMNNGEHADTNVQSSGVQEVRCSDAINSDLLETKVRASFPYLGNFSNSGINKNISNSEGVVNDSSVVCHMTFSADEHNGPANELNNPDDIMGSSVSHCSLPKASLNPGLSLSSLERTPGLFSSGVLQSSSHMEIPTEGQSSLNFLNVNTLPVISVSANETPLNKLPVITSAVSSNEISPSEILAGPSTSHSLPVITSAVSASGRENFVSSNSFAQEENVKVPVDDSPAVEPGSLSRQLYNSFMTDANLNYLFESNEDEEIQIVGEEKQNSIAEEYVKNPSVVRAFTEVLLNSRPQMKKSFLTFHSFILKYFLIMWIEVTFSKFEISDVKNFLELFRKNLKKLEALKKALAKAESEKLEADKARLEAVEAKSEAAKYLALAEIAKAKLEEEVEELKKKVESMGEGHIRNQKAELKDMIILKASQKMQSKVDSENETSENHLMQKIDSLTTQLTEARQKINIKENDINTLREENDMLKLMLTDLQEKSSTRDEENEMLKLMLTDLQEKSSTRDEENEMLKSMLIDLQKKPSTCDSEVQTEETHVESIGGEIQELDSDFVFSQSQDSSQLENPSELSLMSPDQQSLTQSEVQIEMQRNLYIIERVSSVSSSSTLNTGVIQQLYEQNMLTSECTTVMAAPPTPVVAVNTMTPTLVHVPVVNQGQVPIPVVKPGPVFLNAENSATYLKEKYPRKAKDKCSSMAKFSVKRKKKNT